MTMLMRHGADANQADDSELVSFKICPQFVSCCVTGTSTVEGTFQGLPSFNSLPHNH